MIRERIVLILGAGASVPYGFPTGAQLCRWVRGLIDHPKDPFNRSVWDRAKPVLQELGFDEVQQREFVHALSRSGRRSVDAFLEFRQEFVDIGKAFIAYFLILRENERSLFDVTPDWYHYLFDKMNCPLKSFSLNRLSIITFNYDRSFEHFLFTALRNSYGATEDLVASAVQIIPITHVHGQLGLLPWQSGASPENVRPYEATPSARNVRVAADGIKIISEAEDSTPEFEEAHNYLEDAKQVHFLGFGYFPKNMQRLRLPKKGQAHPWLKAALSGTFYDLREPEALKICGPYARLSPSPKEYTTLEYLRNSETFLSACRLE
ncbi:MAG TPA: hypothetical protein VMY37_02815 [Thermoguttaceae bacterium]|nr:hypothetical protein [Thermoguttaceae bacterium]